MIGRPHVLTFTTYQRHPFLRSERVCSWLVESIEVAKCRWSFDLWAYVFMPEHVHLIVRPMKTESTIAAILKGIKQPVGRRAFLYLESISSPWLRKLVRVRNGHPERLFWQSGGGFDRNIDGARGLAAAIRYLHQNPIRRNLVSREADWRWSSAGWFEDAPVNGLMPDRVPPEWGEVE